MNLFRKRTYYVKFMSSYSKFNIFQYDLHVKKCIAKSMHYLKNRKKKEC